MREIPENDPVNNNPRPSWAALHWSDHFAPLIALAIAALLAGSRLPPGVCYGDSGDLQLACATLGIPHPPGYVGYVTIGYIIALVPGVDPAYLVSLACLGSGLAALLLCILVQIRLGVSPWAASAVGLAWTAHHLVWSNLVAPEVYMPSLAFLTGAVYLLIKYSRLGRVRDLLIAAVLFGIAMFNRPPVALAAPFFLLAWWLARRRNGLSWRGSLKPLLLVGGCAVLPGVYSLGYVLWRDGPETPYNYIEEFNAESESLPDVRSGLEARLERAVWLLTGRQFEGKIGNTWRGVRAKLRWVRHRIGPNDTGTFMVGLSLVILGAVVAGRRCGVCCWLLGGMCVQAIVFVCAYRIHGQAADLLPLMFAVAVFAGVALSPLFPVDGAKPGRVIAVALFLAVSIAVVTSGPHTRTQGHGRDATPFLASVNVTTMPERSVIFAGWEESLPLRYAGLVLSDRRDIRIVTAHPANWLRMAEDFGDRPVFVTAPYERLKGHALTPFRNLWRLGTIGEDEAPE